MIRKMLNASRLQQEVDRRIHRLQEVVEDGVKIRVPRPQLQEPDKTSCNWNIAHFGNAVGFERDIDGVLKAVRAEYNLSTESKEASNRSRFKDDSHRFLNFPVSILRREISCASAV